VEEQFELCYYVLNPRTTAFMQDARCSKLVVVVKRVLSRSRRQKHPKIALARLVELEQRHRHPNDDSEAAFALFRFVSFSQ
jgi:hypothetical protein